MVLTGLSLLVSGLCWFKLAGFRLMLQVVEAKGLRIVLAV